MKVFQFTRVEFCESTIKSIHSEPFKNGTKDVDLITQVWCDVVTIFKTTEGTRQLLATEGTKQILKLIYILKEFFPYFISLQIQFSNSKV